MKFRRDDWWGVLFLVIMLLILLIGACNQPEIKICDDPEKCYFVGMRTNGSLDTLGGLISVCDDTEKWKVLQDMKYVYAGQVLYCSFFTDCQ